MEEPDLVPPPPSGPAPELRPSQVRGFATVFYLALLLSGLGWCFLGTGRWLPESVAGGTPLVSFGLGAGTAVIVLLASRLLLRRVGLMRWFAYEVRRLLGPIDRRTALHLSLASGIAEEVFFRGVMQPAAGYVTTSVLFGLVHVGPNRRYLAWTAFAVAMGFILGWILEATGSLVGPIVAHVAVNFVNLRYIGKLPPTPGSPHDEPGAPDQHTGSNTQHSS